MTKKRMINIAVHIALLWFMLQIVDKAAENIGNIERGIAHIQAGGR